MTPLELFNIAIAFCCGMLFTFVMLLCGAWWEDRHNRRIRKMYQALKKENRLSEFTYINHISN